MAPVNLSHRRTHNLLLISKLLGLRDTASPLTLLQDSLEQPATPLIKEYIRRAKVNFCIFPDRTIAIMAVDGHAM
jgi:elongator complex protein 5